MYTSLFDVVSLERAKCRSFEGNERSVADLKPLVLKTLFDWVLASCHLSYSSFLEFLDLCSFKE